MMIKHRFRWFILTITLLSLSFLGVFIGLHQSQSPLEVIAQARVSITQAKTTHSDKYAIASLNAAITYYDSAMLFWQQENDRLFFRRDFNNTLRCAEKASALAQAAIEKSSSEERLLRQEVTNKITKLKKDFNNFQLIYGNVPLTGGHVKNLGQAKLVFQEGIQALKNDNLLDAKEKLATSEELLKKVIAFSTDRLQDYFSSYSDWKKWTHNAIDESRKKQSPCLIVDKYARKCMLYKSGTLKATYDAELGPNWIGDKQYQGDKTTPEGIYKIAAMKSNGQTKYHKAMLLNYPNEEDKKRFNTNKKNGQIKSTAVIGGLIEIHGHGGKGADWTEGCVSLTNDDMDKLFTQCQVDTPVIIVGSTVLFAEILNRI